MAGEFLDSNVLVYAFTADPRAGIAQGLLDRGCVVSVQSLNEFANVSRRKLKMNWKELRDALFAIRKVCGEVLPVDIETHQIGLRISERYGYGIFDGLIVASALRAGCKVLWSEDMQHGAVVERSLRIANPFKT
jgi:predicted nucleic acid-binding protein